MIRVSLSIGLMMIVAAMVQAQRPDDRPGRPDRPPRGFPLPPGFHLMTALDADRDGKISAEEIDQAVVALQKLDKDKDGKLSPEEIGWPPSFGGGGVPGFGGRVPGFGRGPGRGRGGVAGFGGGFPGFGGQASGRPQRPDPDAEASRPSDEPRSNGSPRRRFFSVNQLQRLDRNDDGKISRQEIPGGLQELILSRLDSNQDGVIDNDELAKLAKARDEQP